VDKRTFAIAHRCFTFLDEWLFYLMAVFFLVLHIESDWPLWPCIVVMIWGPVAIIISYARQWKMEKDLD